MRDSYMDVRSQCCGHLSFRPMVASSASPFLRGRTRDAAYPYFSLYPMDQMFTSEDSPEASVFPSPAPLPDSMPSWSTGSESCPATDAGVLEQQFPVAMAYVPWQQWQTTYPPERGLIQGTIFPDLDLKFAFGGCSK